ncbi:MAG: 3-hydroxyacyl-[acyl-carrier-protein] dehydratase FabZ [Tenericutes bacterium HGW-Tenericutes-2]|jgi:3-hydroxyacyl-[acyl-carrier-protein] dehydratase|nr:MAG: 3-hydroxyacyl-[acyl-carrier-protein] dehydratase FabZ [Tenericutes bacterium HGW-Tenericutes-3]PKK97751.1 MAG: 3-hydroxyacyl-[acyl-carrier-protein] dehydratase FabZ [Tenericutes bacterium HGW-Tenericutes-2]PKL00894.1 MAG: 3-hydroxyacyl-[acyl-carrier-protein] dehydratase FabZ [Tenericutes bacterium HGW-Tenericutes-1]
MKLNLEQIKNIIPHRDPFLLVDEVIDYVPLKTGIGLKYVKEDEFYFKGHFPGFPVMPGVLITESLAQMGAIVLLSDPAYAGKLVFFTGIEKAKFRRKVLPGDTLRLEVEITRMRGRFGFGTAVAFVGEEIACEANFSFSVG